VPSEVSRLRIEKCVSYLWPNLVEIISLTLRDHGVRVNCPAKDGGDGRHVLIFHFVGVSKHVAAGRGCNEPDRMCQTAFRACHPGDVTAKRHLENNYFYKKKQINQLEKHFQNLL